MKVVGSQMAINPISCGATGFKSSIATCLLTNTKINISEISAMTFSAILNGGISCLLLMYFPNNATRVKCIPITDGSISE